MRRWIQTALVLLVAAGAVGAQGEEGAIEFDRAKWVVRWKAEAKKRGIELSDAEIEEFLKEEWGQGVAGISLGYARNARTDEPNARKRAVAALSATVLAGRNDIEANAALRLLERFGEMAQERAGAPSWFADLASQLDVGKRRAAAVGAQMRALCRLGTYAAAASAVAAAQRAFGKQAALLGGVVEELRVRSTRARLLVGQRPPALSGATLRGDKFSLAAARGAVVVVYFWSRTDKKSVVALPALNALLRAHRERGLQVIGVGIDDDPKKFTTFCRDWKVAFPQICEGGEYNGAAAKGWAIRRVPRLWVIGRAGMVRHVDTLRHATLEKAVKALLDEKPPPPTPKDPGAGSKSG